MEERERRYSSILPRTPHEKKLRFMFIVMKDLILYKSLYKFVVIAAKER
jgi:hypothetical protein